MSDPNTILAPLQTVSLTPGNVDVPLFALPEQLRRGQIRQKEYILRPRSTRSRVKGHLRLELSFLPRGSRPQPTSDADDELNPTSEPDTSGGVGGLAPLASTDNLEEVYGVIVWQTARARNSKMNA